MHQDSISVLSESVSLTGFEADPVAHPRAFQLGLAVPHDLVSGIRIVLAGAVSGEMGDEPRGFDESIPADRSCLSA